MASGIRARRSAARLATALMIGASTYAIAGASGALAQTTAAATSDPGGDAAVGEVVVTAIRRSLANSQAIKQTSDTVVDVITSEDIGALPDRSVTEALQRLPGVNIGRFENSNDPDHFSPEGQGVVIRGLPYVESQINGRDAFTASKGRSISFQDIPPELLSRIEVFKNQTSDQVEGGIAGNVNLVTRLPLDSNKDLFAFTLQGNYGDLSDRWGPEGSVLGSKQWDTPVGRFGVLGSLSYSQLYTRSDGVEVSEWSVRRTADPARGIDGLGSVIPGLNPGEDYYIPVGGGFRQQEFDRQRRGYSAAAQWESPDRKMMATIQFLRADTTQRWTEDTFETIQIPSQYLEPVAGAPITFDGQHRLTQGTFTFGGTGASPLYAGSNLLFPNGGIPQNAVSRGVDQSAVTNDVGAHFRWQATSRLKLDFDFQYTDSSSSNVDASFYTDTRADERFDLRGDYPQFTPLVPQGAPYTGFSDPNSTFYRAGLDHIEQDDGRQFAGRIDGEFDFDHGWGPLKSVKFGARYADRSQTIRSDAYNWGNLSETWDGGPVLVSEFQPPGFGLRSFGSDFFRNDAKATPIFGYLGNTGANYGAFLSNVAAIENYNRTRAKTVNDAATAAALAAGTIAPGDTVTVISPCCLYTPLGQRSGLLADSLGGDGVHRPSEFSDNSEKTYSGYVRFDFGWEDIAALNGAGIDGNVGVRYVRTETSSHGFLQFPFANDVFGQRTDCNIPLPPNTPPPVYDLCANTPAQQTALRAFADGSFFANDVGQTYDDWLPSVNLRLKVNRAVQFRFAWSRAITRPSFNDLLNYASFSVYQPPTNTVGNPVPGFQAYTAGNPLLRPTKADNFDLTGEWYFNKVGALTVGVFYKRLSNVYSVSNGQTSLDPNGVPINLDSGQSGLVNYTNASGATQTVVAFGTFNNDRIVNVKGLELGYQQTYTFLPGPLSGLGLSANYTYIDADKLDGQANIYSQTLEFPGVSTHNINAALFYEKYNISARLAYNWRSEYLITARDVVEPYQPTYAADSGQLDGSIFYTLTPHWKLGIEGNNILNTNAENLVQINAQGLKATRVIFQTDRRITVALRATF